MALKALSTWISSNIRAMDSGWPAAAGPDLKVGAHLATSRRGYSHHGIYLGGDRVVHYAGLSRSWHSGPVEEVTLARFTLGRALRIIDHPEAAYTAKEIVCRARSRVGERDYRLLTNNCEHFCNWCVSGRSRSAQIEQPKGLPAMTLCLLARLVTRFPAHVPVP